MQSPAPSLQPSDHICFFYLGDGTTPGELNHCGLILRPAPVIVSTPKASILFPLPKSCVLRYCIADTPSHSQPRQQHTCCTLSCDKFGMQIHAPLHTRPPCHPCSYLCRLLAIERHNLDRKARLTIQIFLNRLSKALLLEWPKNRGGKADAVRAVAGTG